jgi:hypothetical protein
MRTALGILLLIGGLIWALPGVDLLRLRLLSTPEVIQTGSGEFLVVEWSDPDINVFGQSISSATACAISLVPGTLFVALGLSFLFSDGRRPTQQSSDRGTD